MVDINAFTLDNGLRVFVYPNKSLHTFAINLSVDYGIFNENKGQSGLAHLIEHMVFEGTKNIRGRELKKSLDNYTTYWNGETTGEITSYDLKSVSFNKINRLIEIIKGMVSDSEFPYKNLVNEKNAAINEVVAKFGVEFGLENVIPKAYLFKREPSDFLGGNPNKIIDLEKEILLQEYKKNYIPNNFVLSVVGKVDTNNIKKEIKRNFDGIEKGEKTGFRNVNLEAVPYREVSIKNPNPYHTQSNIIVGIKLPGSEKLYSDYENARASIGVVRALLTNNFMKNLRDMRGITYTAGADLELGRYSGYMALFSTVKNKDVEIAKKIMSSELEKIINGDIQESTVKNARKASKISFFELQDNTLSFAYAISASILKYGRTPNELYKEGENITIDDLRATEKYFKDYQRKNSLTLISS